MPQGTYSQLMFIRGRRLILKKKKKAFIYYLHLLSPLASQQSDEVGPVSLVL